MDRFKDVECLYFQHKMSDKPNIMKSTLYSKFYNQTRTAGEGEFTFSDENKLEYKKGKDIRKNSILSF